MKENTDNCLGLGRQLYTQDTVSLRLSQREQTGRRSHLRLYARGVADEAQGKSGFWVTWPGMAPRLRGSDGPWRIISCT